MPLINGKTEASLIWVGGGDGDETWCMDSKLVWKWKIEICFSASGGLELLVAAPEI